MHNMLESVMFNSDSLFKIASYLPADGLFNLALTCRRFGIEPVSDGDDDDSSSLVEETARRIVQDIATEEEMNAPGYNEDNWLSKYYYLQSLRAPLTFDQLVGRVDYVKGNKSRVTASYKSTGWTTAFSNNIMIAGKHYVSFEIEVYNETGLYIGVMRPGKAMESAQDDPLEPEFYNHFTQRAGSRQFNNTVNCCMYYSRDGECWLSSWEGYPDIEEWDGMERLSGSFEIGMLLDLDEGTCQSTTTEESWV